MKQETENQYGVRQINYQWYMESKIMEWDHPLSYFQWSVSLWSSLEFRKFFIGLQKQNNYLFNQDPSCTCFYNENSNTLHQCHSNTHHSALCLRSYHFPPCWDLLVFLCLTIPPGKWVIPVSKPFPTFCSDAQHWNPPNHSANPHLPQSPALSHRLPISLAWISFPCIPHSLLASFVLTPILHLPHHLNLFFKPVWRASIAPSHLQLL